MDHDLTRRRLLGLALAGGAGAALGGVGLPLAATRPAAAHSLTDPVSMAMHLHASFSEGPASMHAQLAEAQRHAVDVVWWTEHDFRLQAHGYRREVHFDGREEAEDGVAWTWVDDKTEPVRGARGEFVTDAHSPDEAGAALRLSATGPQQEWGAVTFTGRAWNRTYTTSVVDTTLELDVLAEALGPDAELVVELALSWRPESAGRPAGQYRLQYQVGTGGTRSVEGDGLLGVVPVAATGAWQRLTMRPIDDVAALWPDLVAGDNALRALSVGVRARRGATGRAVVDRLRFLRTGRADPFGLQAGLMAQYADRYPAVTQRQASELSLVRHLNAFGGARVLPAYADPRPRKDDSLEAAAAMVAWAHAQQSLVSHNHPLDGGVENRHQLARMLLATRNLGADLLEVGCPQDVEDIAYAFDVAARNSLFVTATGVSDDHAGHPWETAGTRWVTSAWAASREEPDLLSAVGAGRAWFWDLAGWRGAMELSVHGAPAMGGVLVTSDPATAVAVQATDLPAGGTLEVVVGRVDDAGEHDAKPAVDVRRYATGAATVEVPPGSYLRSVVRSARGDLVGFSNPVWVLGAEPALGVPLGRRLT